MHDAIIIEVSGKKVEVDRKIAPLVQELNRIGLETTHSCQGGNRKFDKGRAYVSIQLGTDSEFHYHIEEKVLTIRWNLPENKGKFMPEEPIDVSYIDTDFGNWKLAEVLPILEREQKARFGNLSYKYKIRQAEIILAYEDAYSKRSSAGYVSLDELYLRLRYKYRLSIDDFRAAMIDFYDRNRFSFSFAPGSCSRTEVKKYGFPAGGKWIYYIQKT
ncbi:MAG: hypothetical protein PHW62_00065 [Candidatus Ratteibacteria bacterium]|nr:hypothetical protein [Candidatus Ratteibacteria bacterium]